MKKVVLLLIILEAAAAHRVKAEKSLVSFFLDFTRKFHGRDECDVAFSRN